MNLKLFQKYFYVRNYINNCFSCKLILKKMYYKILTEVQYYPTISYNTVLEYFQKMWHQQFHKPSYNHICNFIVHVENNYIKNLNTIEYVLVYSPFDNKLHRSATLPIVTRLPKNSRLVHASTDDTDYGFTLLE